MKKVDTGEIGIYYGVVIPFSDEKTAYETLRIIEKSGYTCFVRKGKFEED